MAGSAEKSVHEIFLPQLTHRTRRGIRPKGFVVCAAVVVAGMDRLDRVSDSMACLLSLCDGRHRIAEIVPRLSATLHDVKAPLGEYVCLRLLSGAQAEQFIDIYRTASSPKKETRSRGTAPRLFHRAHTIIGTLAFLMPHSPLVTSCPGSQL